MQENIIAIIKTILAFLLFILFIGFGIGGSISIPDNAKVYADDGGKTYIGLPSVPPNKSGLRITTIKDVHNLKYNPDPKSRDNGDFIQEGRSLSGNMLEKIGILPQLKSRWNKDGTWNW